MKLMFEEDKIVERNGIYYVLDGHTRMKRLKNRQILYHGYEASCSSYQSIQTMARNEEPFFQYHLETSWGWEARQPVTLRALNSFGNPHETARYHPVCRRRHQFPPGRLW